MFEGPPYHAALVTATVLSVVLFIITWRNRQRSGAVPFLVLLGGLSVWTATTFLASFDPVPGHTVIWYRLTYVGIPMVVLGWFLFALEFTGRREWITPGVVGLLLVEPIVVQLLVWTNDFHTLFWRELPTDPLGSATYGIGFWMHTLYSYVLIAAGAALLISFAIRSRTLYRDQVVAILLAASVPWLANIGYLFTSYQADLTPLAVSFSSVAFAWSMFRYGFMDVVPIARETVIDEMNDGVLVLDTEGRIVDLNRAILPLLEADDTEEVIGRPVEDVLARTAMTSPEATERAESVEKAELDLDLDADLRPAEGGATEGALADFFNGDIRSRRTIELELTTERDRTRVYELTLSPFHANKPRLTGQLLVAQDVTVRKRRERQLEGLALELERRTQEQSALIENLPGMVYRMESVTDHSCSFVSTAAESVTGYPARTFESGDRSLHDLIHGDERQRVLDRKRNAVDDGERYDVTYRIRDASDAQRWVRDIGEGIFTSNGELSSVEGVILDVTESKEREQLQVLNRVLRHNIRNEMNVIKGYARMAASDVPEETAAHLRIVERKSDTVMRMSEKARIVQQLLGTPTGTTQTVDVMDSLHDALFKIDSRHGELVRGRVEITVTGDVDDYPDGDDPLQHALYVRGDTLLSLGLYELLENAVVHSGDQPRIDVTVDATDDVVELRIVDSGPGMPHSEQEVLETGIESPLEHGSGLGLWICQWIVGPYGDLEFKSDDDGTTAIVRFARADPDDGTTADPDDGTTGAPDDENQFADVAGRSFDR